MIIKSQPRTRVKVISDGTPWGTTIVNTETGAQLQNVSRIELKLTRDEQSCVVELVNVEVEYTGPARVLTETIKVREDPR